MTVIKTNALHDIKSNWIGKISGIKINYVLYPIRRNMIQNIINRIAVGVYISYAASGLNILNGHILQKFRLAHSGRTNHIHMASSIILLNAKAPLIIAEISLTQNY